MFEAVPSLHLRPRGVRLCLLLLLSALALPAAALAEGGGRYGTVEARVEALIDAVQALRTGPEEDREAAISRLLDDTVDLEAWLGDAVPAGERLTAVERGLLLDRARALLLTRALRHLQVEGAARITVEKTRRARREVAIDCLIHTADAIYEITLRWADGPRPRLRDVQVEGVSVGAADRRRVRRAWDRGGLAATLAALDRAIGRMPTTAFSGPPAVATRTTSGDPPPVDVAPPSERRPPGL